MPRFPFPPCDQVLVATHDQELSTSVQSNVGVWTTSLKSLEREITRVRVCLTERTGWRGLRSVAHMRTEFHS